jgi:hypothetical protein
MEALGCAVKSALSTAHVAGYEGMAVPGWEKTKSACFLIIRSETLGLRK